MEAQNEKEFYIKLIESFANENEELKKNFEDWKEYHNEIINYLNQVILDLDKENAILRKELNKYESK